MRSERKGQLSSPSFCGVAQSELQRIDWSQACNCTWEAAKGNKAAIVTISEMHRTRMEFRQVPTNQDSAAPPLMTLFAPPRTHTHTAVTLREGNGDKKKGQTNWQSLLSMLRCAKPKYVNVSKLMCKCCKLVNLQTLPELASQQSLYHHI